ncbi:hypothetical protein GCM10020218_054210 [Dactylosporangium vinaceum]
MTQGPDRTAGCGSSLRKDGPARGVRLRARGRESQSQPLDWATPTASMRLRVPVFVIAADR